MPRLPRVHLEGVLYYVTCRGDAAQPLFHEQQDYEVYARLLEQYRQRHAFKLFAYCLLPDHVHLCLELSAEGGTISAIMHDLTTRYTKYFNKRHGRSGHLFQERFRSVLVEKAPYLLPLTTYLHLHPVRSGLVTEPAEYRFNSYPHYLSGGQWAAGPDLTTTIPEVFAGLPSPELASGPAYAQYVSRFSSRELDLLREGLQRRILGSDEFVAQIRGLLKAHRHAEAQPVTAHEPQPVPVRRPRLQPAWHLVTAGLMVGFGLMTLSIYRRAEWLQQALVSLKARYDVMLPAHVTMASHAGMTMLKDSTWDIQLVPMYAGPSTALQQDALVFTDRRVSSTALVADGYQPSAYRTVHQPDGMLVWEAAQTNATGTIISWRGECQGDMMRGIMSRQAVGKLPEQLNFVGVIRKAEEPARSET